MSEAKEIYDQIASSWYNYRHHTRFSSELEALAQHWGAGKLLNIGCAHGPDFLPFRKNFELYGIDISPNMLEMGRQYAEKFGFTVDLTAADAAQIPYPDKSFEYAISIATYHHIRGEDERFNALGELHRILKLGGEAFVTVWNRWQPRFWRRGKEIQEPWHTGEDTLYRYYYLFSYSEFEKLVKRAGFEVLKSSPESRYHFPLKTFSRNICLLVKKPSS